MLRKLSINAALIAGSLIIALSFLELGVRLYDGIPVLQLANFVRDRVDQFRTNAWNTYHEKLGWVPKPNTGNTDAYGNRIANETDRALPQGAILASGDSFTYGDDVGDKESWPAFLQSMTGTPVVNASSPGWGTDQIVMRAEEMADITRPKTVILAYFWHDIERSEYEMNFGAHKPYYLVEGGKLVLHNVPVPPFVGNVREMGFTRAVLGYSYFAFWLARRLGLNRWLGSTNSQYKRITVGLGPQITCLLMKRLKEHTERKSIRLMLAMVYGSHDFGRAQPPSAIAVLGCAREIGFDTVDTWAAFAEIFAGHRKRFRSLFITKDTGSHMSADGNRLVAAAIAQRLAHHP